VRTLANPGWTRDADRLVRFMETKRSNEQGRRRDLLDLAIASARGYRRLKQRPRESDDTFSKRRDDAWDDVLTRVDAYLELVQRAHLREVANAGASGPPSPRLAADEGRDAGVGDAE
jgi:hypothetical protein